MSTAAVESECVANIHRAIAAKRFPEAAELCAAGMRAHPRNLRLKIQHGVILRHGNAQAARDYFLDLLDSHPKVAELEFKLAELALASGELEEAERRIAAASAKGGASRIALTLGVAVARKKGDLAGERASLERILEDSDTVSVSVAVRLAEVCSRLKDSARALDLLQRALEAEPGNMTAHAALANIAEAMGDDPLAEREMLRLIELSPDSPQWYARAQRLYLHLGREDKAEEILRAGLSRGLAGAVLLQHITWLPPIADLADQLLGWARGVGKGAPADVRGAVQSILLHYAPPRGAVAPEDLSLAYRRLLMLSPPDAALKRPAELAQVLAEVQASRPSASGCVALVFLGLANRAMLPTEIFDRFLAALDISALYIQDNRRLSGIVGVASLGKTFEDTVDALQGMLREQGCRRCITIGSSAGGYPALRYGLRLGAEKILCFSGPTNITAEFLVNDGRASIIARRVQALPREVLDMKPHVLAAEGQSEIHMFYGERHQLDSMHARYLEGCPGVRLHPLEGLEDHWSILALARERRLLSTLREAIGAAE